MISKLVTRLFHGDKGGTSDTAVREVTRFMTVNNSLLFPALVQSRDPARPGFLGEVETKEIEINIPIDEAELGLEFPAGCVVYDFPRMRYHIWGEGVPAETFTTERYNQWVSRKAAALMSAPRRDLIAGWFGWLIFIMALVVLLVLFAVRRRLLRVVT